MARHKRTFAVPDSATTNEDTALPFLDVLGNDRGPNNLNARHVAAVDAAGTLGLVTVLPNGSGVSYDPGGAFEFLAADESATDTFTYTHQRGRAGATEAATVTVMVTGVNDAPVAQDDAFTTDEDARLSGNVLADNGKGVDSDVDLSDTLEVSEVQARTKLGAQIMLPSGALLTLNGDGSFEYDPNSAFGDLGIGDSTTDAFTYTLSDGHGGSDTATVTVTIQGVDDASRPDLDALVVNATTPKSSKMLTNDGQGNFAAADLPGRNPFSYDIALGDLDGDGDLDALVANSGVNEALTNDGQGNFTAADLPGTFRFSYDVALGDLDGDGDLDALIANSGFNQVLTNDGEGNFVATDEFFGGLHSRGAALGDLDGDGDLDALVANGLIFTAATNRLLTNDGEGEFSGTDLPGTRRFSYDVALGDLDGDGDLDALIANIGYNQVLINDGSGSFIAYDETSGENRSSLGVALGDLDGDGDLDALIVNNVRPNQVLTNDGEGGFTAADLPGRSGNNWKGVALGDLDGDGDLDILIPGGGQMLTNNGQGNFTAADIGSVGTGVALGDLDGDGGVPVVTASNLPNLGDLVPMPAETVVT